MTKLITPDFVLRIQNNNETPTIIQVMSQPIKFRGSIEFKAAGFDELFRLLGELEPFILAQGVDAAEFENVVNAIKDRIQNRRDWNVTKALHAVPGLVIGVSQISYSVNSGSQYRMEVERDGWICKQANPNQLSILLKLLPNLGIPLDKIIPLLAEVDVSEKNPDIYYPDAEHGIRIKLFNL